MKEFTGPESRKQDDVKNESVVKDRFEGWMKQYNRTYSTEEEKAMRFEQFKSSARSADKYTEGKLDRFADWTAYEYERYKNPHHCVSFDWETIIDEVNSKIAQGDLKSHRGFTSFNPEKMVFSL